MLPKEEALRKIESLVLRFEEQKEFYTKSDYNETQTRRDFIDPFWKALGWDVDNENGYAESYREVIHEDKIKIGGATKAPDYSFRLPGGKRLFFLEAKKPSVEIKEDMQPAYQIRRYGWSAKMPISVITDFEEFAIYDCTNKPKPTDKASNGRIKYITYDNYIKEFDFIWDTFSKERVLKGSFDKYISSDKNKKGTTTVDHDFLASLDKWRIEIARNIALRNKILDEDLLNFVVQATLDRIIFLRIAEDRGAERYGELLSIVQRHSERSEESPAKNENTYYQNLLHRFNIADQKYNSGLFDFQKDTISKHISIDNKVIKSIISELYYPVCPYEFSVLSVEILGSAYEQFLGKTISLSKSGRATIEEKPEVRKAGGVYYTPQYIVEYIVKNTVGKLVEGKTPKEVSEIKICDPACGSGSFLIGAYQYLLNWHKDYYLNYELQITNYEKKKGRKDDVLTPMGELITAEKKRILLNNIYGVDLDSNAVEVTKLSLLLKCMEGETAETIDAQTKIFHDRILPTLDNNIKSGNSLIDLDYYDSQLDFGEERKIKPFSWKKAFPEVFDRYVSTEKPNAVKFKEEFSKAMKTYKEAMESLIDTYVKEPEHDYKVHASGFDCVIGNPPYVKEYTNRETFEHIKKSHLHKYYQGKMDLWYFFVCYGIDILKPNGLLGYIAPNNWITNAGASILRNKVLSDSSIKNIVDFGAYMVFDSASIQTMILILEKQNLNAYSFDYRKLVAQKPSIQQALKLLEKETDQELKYIEPIVNTAALRDKFLVFGDYETESLLNKIQEKQNFILDARNEITNGIHPHFDFISKQVAEKSNGKFFKGQGIFGLSYEEKENLQLNEEEKELIKPYYSNSEQLGKFYGNSKNKLWIIYTTSDFKNVSKIREYPNIKKHLDNFKSVITSDNKPYGLHRSREEKFFVGEKIISLRKCTEPTFTFTEFDCYASATFYIIKTDRLNQKYLTAFLNSKLTAFWLKHKGKMQGNIYQVDKEPILNIPIFDPPDNTVKAQIIKLVDHLLHLNKDLQHATLPEKIEQLKQRIEYNEEKINEIVYELYGLTEEEIKIIETYFTMNF
jgi:adenine-specific DNA-methyltransferase